MDIDCIMKITSIVAGIGTFIAAIIAVFTLREIKRQRIAAQKPQLLFNTLTIGELKIAPYDIEIPTNWIGKNKVFGERVLFEFINAGKEVAKNITFEFKLNIDSFIKLIKEKDTDNEINISYSKGILRISLNTIASNKVLSFKIKKGPRSNLEYLLTRNIQEKPSGFAIPNEYLILNSCLMHLSKEHKFQILSDKIPLLFVKTQYEDISGNVDTLFYAIDTFHFKDETYHFSMKRIKKKIYVA
jgi:hypothetical protein